MPTQFIRTTPDYWDCECDDDYIQYRSEKRCYKCGCQRFRDGRPDSTIAEVIKFGFYADLEVAGARP